MKLELDWRVHSQLLRDKLIRVQKHPTLDLFIANYTEQVQFDKLWDVHPLLVHCRGLIWDDDYNIVARPFRKFFNLGEHQGPLPVGPFEVTDKMDGSLGILYWTEQGPFIATRGSFESEQADAANDILWSKYLDKHIDLDSMGRDVTLLFEIIYPENRIVVNYGDQRDLVFITAIDNETGRDIPSYRDWMMRLGFPVVEVYDTFASIEALINNANNSEKLVSGLHHPDFIFEGYVVRWPGHDDYRLKVKLDEYLRLHKLMTGVTARRVWEVMSAGDDLNKWLDKVPDEFAQWVLNEAAHLTVQFKGKLDLAMWCFEDIIHKFEGSAYPDRKQFAAEAIKHEQRDILFAMYDHKKFDHMIWKRIKPAAETPFKKAEEQ